MINFSLIDENIFVGSSPATAIDVNRLATAKITAVLSLQSDEDLKQRKINWKKLTETYQQANISVKRFPIKDFSESDLAKKLAEPVNYLKSMIGDGHRVYVHCNAGICRAPATVIGYLCLHKGMTIEQALEFLRSNRPQVNPYIGALQSFLASNK